MHTTEPKVPSALQIQPSAAWHWALIALLAVMWIALPAQYKPLPWGMPLREALSIGLLILLLQQAGSWAMRWMGMHHGLAVMGLASGFVSSTATVAAMGSLARQHPSHAKPLAIGALLSCTSTLIQAYLILNVVQAEVAKAVFIPFLAAAIVLFLTAALLRLRLHPSDQTAHMPMTAVSTHLWQACGFMVLIYGVSVLSQWAWQFGDVATTAVILLAALADVHSAILAASQLQMTHPGTLAPGILITLMAITVNACLKIWIAFISAGDGLFSKILLAGIGLSCAVLWASMLF